MNADACLDSGCDQKAWQTLVAKCCLKGYQLWRSDPADGVQRYFVARWGMVRCLADAPEVQRFIEQAGVA